MSRHAFLTYSEAEAFASEYVPTPEIEPVGVVFVIELPEAPRDDAALLAARIRYAEADAATVAPPAQVFDGTGSSPEVVPIDPLYDPMIAQPEEGNPT